MNILHIVEVAVVFLLMITVLVAAHEYGHYLFARLFRMGVHEFALGMAPPKLLVWRRKKTTLDDGSELVTEFTIRPLPIGGFVRILGMEPAEDGSERNIPNGFYSRPAWQRFIVLLAGPVFSVVAGLAVLTPLFWANGVEREATTIVDLDPSYGASKAGARKGDVIVSIDGTAVKTGYDARVLVRDRTSGPIRLSLLRSGKPVEIVATPKIDEEPLPQIDRRGLPTGDVKRQARLGIAFGTERMPVGLGGALTESIDRTTLAFTSVSQVFTRPKQAKENVGGVVSMVGVTSAVVDQGLEQTLGLAAMLSISIGIFNLLPIPPLDGGQMLLAIVEMVRGGRRPSLRFQSALVTLGSALLLTLFVGVFILDVSRVLRNRQASEQPPVSAPVRKPSRPSNAAPATPATNR